MSVSKYASCPCTLFVQLLPEIQVSEQSYYLGASNFGFRLCLNAEQVAMTAWLNEVVCPYAAPSLGRLTAPLPPDVSDFVLK